MTWLHTWLGLSVGWVLYFIFVTGTVGYFYVEVDRWMRPELPMATAQPSAVEATRLADSYLRANAANADHWSVALPVGRQHTELEVAWGDGSAVFGHTRERRVYDPTANIFEAPVKARNTQGLYGVYRMHWKLHYLPQNTGVLIVGICTMFMLVAIVTGVVAHKKIFADFFTFRPQKGQRSWLDMHNLMSVLALPFIIMITYSGLIFFMETYVPAGVDAVYGGDFRTYYSEIEPVPKITRADSNATMLPLTHFIEAAPSYWNGGVADRLTVQYPGAANAQVVLLHAGNGTVFRDVTEFLRFNAVTGELIEHVSAQENAPRAVQSMMFGLHEGVFAGPVLRWIYFISGLMGCVMIATGLVLWTVKRRARQTNPSGDFGFRLVECLNIGSIAGVPAALAVYLMANRLIPADFAGRQPWEYHALFITWGVMLVYAAVRPRARAWREEFAAAAVLCALVPVVNAATTDRHLGATLGAGDWALAGVDLTLLAFAMFFAACSITVQRRTS